MLCDRNKLVGKQQGSAVTGDAPIPFLLAVFFYVFLCAFPITEVDRIKISLNKKFTFY